MRNLKKLTRNYFIFSKKERNVALYLALFIVIITFFPTIQKQFFHTEEKTNFETLQTLFISFPVDDESSFENNKNSLEFKQRYDEDQYTKPYYPQTKSNTFKSSQQVQLFVFDPNVITVEQWKQLGITSWMAERIINYRNKGGKFKKKEDLLKTYGFTNEDFNRLEKYIEIDTSQFIVHKSFTKNQTILNEEQIITDLNTANKEQLMSLGFSADNAIRIIKFKESAGGIYSIDQLNTVFGIDMESLENARTFLTIDVSQLNKMNINTISFEQLANHAYISDELAQSIIDYRSLTGKFYAITELMKVKGMYPSLYEKLKPYLIL